MLADLLRGSYGYSNNRLKERKIKCNFAGWPLSGWLTPPMAVRMPEPAPMVSGWSQLTVSTQPLHGYGWPGYGLMLTRRPEKRQRNPLFVYLSLQAPNRGCIKDLVPPELKIKCVYYSLKNRIGGTSVVVFVLVVLIWSLTTIVGVDCTLALRNCQMEPIYTYVNI